MPDSPLMGRIPRDLDPLLCASASAQFPDAHDPPPAGWTGPVFRLKQDYPQTLPSVGSRPWMSFDFRTQPNEYIKAVLDYALDGNKQVDFVVQNNTTRGWYHAPWMHAGAAGREFVRGLTRESSSRPGELHPTQTGTFENWAVSVYNPRGGYTLGQVWKDPDAPNPGVAKFPVGSVSIKLIFTEAPVSQVPYLAGSVEWQADINRANNAGPRPTLRLLQVDVAVRESRAASTTGWVFGTFVYDGNAPGATPWDKLVPVGLMWGNDPTRVRTGPGAAADQDQCRACRYRSTSASRSGSTARWTTRARPACPAIRRRRSRTTCRGPTARRSRRPTRRCRRCACTSATSRPAQPFDANARALDYSLQLQNGIANWAQTMPVRRSACRRRRRRAARGAARPLARHQHPARRQGRVSMATRKKPFDPADSPKLVLEGRVVTMNGVLQGDRPRPRLHAERRHRRGAGGERHLRPRASAIPP